jgi:hypothetical protein
MLSVIHYRRNPLESTCKMQHRYYEYRCLLGSDEVQSYRPLKTFRSDLPTPSLKMEAVASSSEKFLTVYETTRRHTQTHISL